MPTSPSLDEQAPDENTENQDVSTQPLGLAAGRRPFANVAVRCLARWLVTAAVVGAMAGILFHYASKPVMDSEGKRIFNTLITGLSIGLGLAITSSLDDMIRDLRWCLLARRHRSRRKVERILQADKITNLLQLALTSHRLTIHGAVTAWIILLLGAQIAVSALGLCYSLDAATDQALLVPGDLLVADMSTIQTYKLLPSTSAELDAQQYTAYSYGLISSGFNTAPLGSIPEPGSIFAPGDALIFLGTESASYVFRDTSAASAAASGTNPVAIITPRSVTASSVCRGAPVTQGGDGSDTQITIADPSDSSTSTTIILPLQVANGSADQTTYMINTTQSCGEGCVPITVFEASLTNPWYYTCNTTVSPVANALRPEHEISLGVRTMAAGGIALQGISSSWPANVTVVAQSQNFPAEVFFGLPTNGSVSAVALVLSEFAIGVVASTAEWNDPLVIKGGTAPARGDVLTIKHTGAVMAILIGAVVVQLVLEVGVAVWSYRVGVPPDDMVSQAQVLRQMTMVAGCVHEKKIGKAERSEPSWIYRATPLGSSGLYDLHFEKRCL
ncbi:uncharacterized protein B0I36DRAFT_393751 [Microdochium trichocladiopsis]|uniref:Uncharacterized protein n=1 Tax=Microdochium trichocladiopsis TaxID=1682393 RepID=A0A9P8XWW2_9PEZI|nr:uncharacterized protein B0I36DRAFT_393751 [Microdochium trichocladiopsis]KAH7021396.1 hypothetical protein B0I36DRAFT_393751 [Microdochium trichocladiopsis]